MNRSVLVEAVDLGVRFWVERRERAFLRDILLRRDRRRPPGRELWALRHVTLSLEPGDVLGVIGSNGAGKTTLLMALAGIYAPDEGHVRLRGRVTSLLEVGAGFRPELTGRENVFLYGAILGFPRGRVHALFDRIVTFAGLEAFIDTPMRAYSAGMRMRLGFAIAMSVDPDLLLVDEALSIGDSAFQNRALERIQTFRRNGGSLVFVSHDMTRVGNLCDRCLLLERGRAVRSGETLDVIAAYWETVWGTEVVQGGKPVRINGDASLAGARRWGSGEIRVTAFAVRDGQGRPAQVIEHGKPFLLEIRFEARSDLDPFLVQVALFRGRETVAVMKSEPGAWPTGPNRRNGKALLRVDSGPLEAGRYLLDLEIRDEGFTRMYDHLDKFAELVLGEAAGSATGGDPRTLPCQWTFSEGDSGG